MHYRRWSLYGDPGEASARRSGKARVDIEQRFWARVQKAASDDPYGCSEWTGPFIQPRGYGVLGLGGKGAGMVYVHRFAYELLVEPIPEGWHIDHLCHNTACVNPDHMELVTAAENTWRAGRARARHTAAATPAALSPGDSNA